jgi:hypothetical protein
MFPNPAMGSIYDNSPRAISAWRMDEKKRDEAELIIERKDKNKGYKFRIAVITTILFIVFSHPATYRLTNQIYQALTNRMYQVIGEDSNPTFKGIVIHSILFFLIIMYNLY